MTDKKEAKVQRSFRLNPTFLADLDAYAKAHNLTRTDALEELVNKGLQSTRDVEEEPSKELTEPTGDYLGVLSKQLDAKDKQIDTLNKTVLDLTASLSDVTKLTEHTAQIASQSQALHYLERQTKPPGATVDVVDVEPNTEPVKKSKFKRAIKAVKEVFND